MELVLHADERDCGLHTVERVVTGVACHQVVSTRRETVRVEQTRDTRAGHATPVVVVAAEKAKQYGHLGVTCETRQGAGAYKRIILPSGHLTSYTSLDLGGVPIAVIHYDIVDPKGGSNGIFVV